MTPATPSDKSQLDKSPRPVGSEHQYDYRPPPAWRDYALLPIVFPLWLLMKYYSGTRYITGGYLPPLMFLWLIPPAGALWAVDSLFNLGIINN